MIIAHLTSQHDTTRTRVCVLTHQGDPKVHEEHESIYCPRLHVLVGRTPNILHMAKFHTTIYGTDPQTMIHVYILRRTMLV